MGKTFNKRVYEEIYKHKDWEKTADKYEEEFAAKLYKTSYVQQAARTALTKLSGMLNAYYENRGKVSGLSEETASDGEAACQAAAEMAGEKQEGHPGITSGADRQAPGKTEEISEEASDSFGGGFRRAVKEGAEGSGEADRFETVAITDTLMRALLPHGDSSKGAGQIGNYQEALGRGAGQEKRLLARKTDEDNLNEVINGSGNLREQMTLLYNGIFVNGGHSREEIARSRSLKNMMAYISRQDIRGIPQLGGIRYDLLKHMRQRIQKGDVFDTFSFARDLKIGSAISEGRENPALPMIGDIYGYAATFSRTMRTARSDQERAANRLGLAYYDRLGLGLSERERANGVRDGQLQWEEGRAVYEIRNRISAGGMLQTAGPSGTATRMLGAYKLMGASLNELLYFRLALIAWMVSSKDHSLYEILRGSHTAGVWGRETIWEPAEMYMTVDPIPEEELRRSFAMEGRFPHEIVYQIMLEESGKSLPEESLKRQRERGGGEGHE